MPPKKKFTGSFRDRAPWLAGLADPCLEAIIEQAILARDFAIRSGAMKHKPCEACVKKADAIMIGLEYGGFGDGWRAWKAAVDAVRKYTVAFECSHPTARRL